jgi:UDP-N-acetylglucosamine 2-epimerase (non-hydrolysing)
MEESSAKRISVVLGTRPEAIKLCPVIEELRGLPGVQTRVCLTAQHRTMVDSVLEDFQIRPDVDLDLMTPDQTLAGITSRLIEALDRVFTETSPEIVLVQGDTSTALAAALTAYYHRIAVGHVEAGLRTGNVYAPFPEEMNRRLTAPLAELHFAPTHRARRHLLDEGVPAERIHVTGNTVIDALLRVRERNQHRPPELPPEIERALEGRRMVLVTGHRRESFGPDLEQMCLALGDLVALHPDVAVVYAVHLNPNVQTPVRTVLGGVARVHLLPPQDYPRFVRLMDRSHLVLTDSGGIQEEAPALGKPVLVTRATTERPEGVEAGNARLVGCNRQAIVTEVSRLLSEPDAYREMATARNPYGDGQAAVRIARILCGMGYSPWSG